LANRQYGLLEAKTQLDNTGEFVNLDFKKVAKVNLSKIKSEFQSFNSSSGVARKQIDLSQSN
jgi:hypothetical protein